MLRSLFRGRFARSVIAVASGTAIAQALTVAISPILTRVYGPSDFGALGSFSAIISVVGVIACLRLEHAVMLPDDDAEASRVALAAVATSMGSAALTALVLAVVLSPWAGLGVDPKLVRVLWWLPVSVFALGVFQVGTQWLARMSSFRAIGRAHVLRSVFANGVPLAFASAAIGPLALVGGNVLGQIAASSSTLFASRRSLRLPRLRPRAVWDAIRGTYHEHYRFAVYSTPQALLNAANQAMPVAILGIGFDIATIGQYALAHRFLKAPVNLVGQSIRQVLYPRLVRAHREGNMARLAVRSTTMLGLAVLLPLGLVAAFGPQLFAWLLGDAWFMAGRFASLSSIWMIAAFSNVAAVSMIPILNLQRAHAIFEVVYIGARLAALVLGVRMGSAVAAVGLAAAVGVLFNLALIGFVLTRAWQRERTAAG